MMISNFTNIVIDRFPEEGIVVFLSAIAAMATIAVLWKYRNSNEVRYLIFVETFVSVWSLMYGMEFTSSNIESKVFWSQLSYFGIAFLPVSYFLFTTSFSQNTKIITPLNIALLSIIPFLTLSLVLTNNHHHLVWAEVRLSPDQNMLNYRRGIIFWIFWVHSLFMIFGGLFNLVRSIYEFMAYYKTQVATLLVATLIPLIGNVMYVTGLNPVPGFDWTPVLFMFTGLVITFGIVRYRMFDLVPFARNKLIDTMSEGVIVVNGEGFIEDCNPSVNQIFNLKNKTIIRERFSEVFKQHQNLVDSLENKVSKIEVTETELAEKDRFYQARISPVFNRNRQFSGHLVQINNITSLKNTENMLIKVNQQLEAEVEERGRLIDDLDAFAHTIAHDLRNSLGSVYSSTELIQESIKNCDAEMLGELSRLIKETSYKAIRITQELLILATVSHQNIEKKPLEMDEIFSDAKTQIGDLIAKSKAEISSPGKWLKALGYASWIEEVWTNYLTNAIKYGGVPPKIITGAEKSGNGNVRFWIQDNGNGILPENHTRLFQKYVRLAPEKAEGYGLGLSIVKRIVEKLDGKVGVESTGKDGEGAKFWFELPEI